MNRDGQNPQGITGTWEQAKGRKGGGSQSWYTASDAGMWHGAQRRAMEAFGWRMRVTSAWAEICARRGGVEQLQTHIRLQP